MKIKVIQRDEAIKALQKEIDKAIPPFDDTIGAIRAGVRLARNIIEDLPYIYEDDTETVEAEPVKHGRWIEVQRINPTDRMAICECSLCGDTIWVYDGQRTWSYCPNCGAKMDEVEE